MNNSSVSGICTHHPYKCLCIDNTCTRVTAYILSMAYERAKEMTFACIRTYTGKTRSRRLGTLGNYWNHRKHISLFCGCTERYVLHTLFYTKATTDT